jgi:hypothetical protein
VPAQQRPTASGGPGGGQGAPGLCHSEVMLRSKVLLFGFPWKAGAVAADVTPRTQTIAVLIKVPAAPGSPTAAPAQVAGAPHRMQQQQQQAGSGWAPMQRYAGVQLTSDVQRRAYFGDSTSWAPVLETWGDWRLVGVRTVSADTESAISPVKARYKGLSVPFPVTQPGSTGAYLVWCTSLHLHTTQHGPINIFSGCACHQANSPVCLPLQSLTGCTCSMVEGAQAAVTWRVHLPPAYQMCVCQASDTCTSPAVTCCRRATPWSCACGRPRLSALLAPPHQASQRWVVAAMLVLVPAGRLVRVALCRCQGLQLHLLLLSSG